VVGCKGMWLVVKKLDKLSSIMVGCQGMWLVVKDCFFVTEWGWLSRKGVLMLNYVISWRLTYRNLNAVGSCWRPNVVELTVYCVVCDVELISCVTIVGCWGIHRSVNKLYPTIVWVWRRTAS